MSERGGTFRAPRRIAAFLAVILAFLAGHAPVHAAEKNLPVPRFVSLKHGEVNLRVGPGAQYPIDWVYQRKDMPVEIIQEYQTWRRIRDWEGTEGWVLQTALSGRRSVVVKGEIRTVRGAANPAADPVAHVEPGVIGRLLECPSPPVEWCRIEVGDIRGWIRRGEIWGVYPDEAFP